jgi:hypothetical protein
LWNAVASALDDYCREHDYPRPYFSQRNKVAAQVWRTLHPDSRLTPITERPTDE